MTRARGSEPVKVDLPIPRRPSDQTLHITRNVTIETCGRPGAKRLADVIRPIALSNLCPTRLEIAGSSHGEHLL